MTGDIRIVVARKTEWDAFLQTVPEGVPKWFRTYPIKGRPNFSVYRVISEPLWEAAHGAPNLFILKHPMTSANRLPQRIKDAIGGVSADAVTVMDVLEDLTGRTEF